MAQKQGGKGKQSSQSDKNYWSRIAARTGKISARKAANIKKAGKLGGTVPEFPRIPVERKKAERVVFSGTVKPQAGFPLHLIRVAGVLVEISPRLSDASCAIAESGTRLEVTHGVLNPLTGRVQAVSLRPAN